MMAGFLLEEFQLRQRALEYYLWRLTYDEDLTTANDSPPLNRWCAPETLSFMSCDNWIA